MQAIKGMSIALAITSVFAAGASTADDGRKRPARAYDVCVNAGVDARFNLTGVDFGGNPIPEHPGPGDRVTGVGMLLPAGTIPTDGSGDVTCNSYQARKIGTFFVNGTFVSTFTARPLPQAAANDLAYVDWHFRVDGAGAFDTSGPIKQFAQGGTYPHTIVGGTGRFKSVKGELTTLMLGAGGFQLRVFLPNGD